MIEKMQKILELILEIKNENEVIGDILLTNFKNSLDIMNFYGKGDSIEISKKINIISELLGFDLEEFILELINKNNTDTNISLDSDADITNFILKNSSDSNIDDYENFLKNSNIENKLN